jgi:HNH endonuclease
MRGLIRLPKPQILIDKEDKWKKDFIVSGKARPDSSKYGHDKIRIQLISMSSCKCFYCESKLNDKPKEVDHHIEVSVQRELSFTWNNLYLCCDNCNNKLNHDAIPIHEALDPCRNNDTEIQEHLTFVDEMITAIDGSQLGFKTIQKYRLDSELLDKRRITQLKNFHKVLIQILSKQNADGRKDLNEIELKTLNFFKQADQPYSLMFKVILDKMPIQV